MKIIIRTWHPDKGALEVTLEGQPTVKHGAGWTSNDVFALLLNAEMHGNSNGESRIHIMAEGTELEATP